VIRSLIGGSPAQESSGRLEMHTDRHPSYHVANLDVGGLYSYWMRALARSRAMEYCLVGATRRKSVKVETVRFTGLRLAGETPTEHRQGRFTLIRTVLMKLGSGPGWGVTRAPWIARPPRHKLPPAHPCAICRCSGRKAHGQDARERPGASPILPEIGAQGDRRLLARPTVRKDRKALGILADFHAPVMGAISPGGPTITHCVPPRRCAASDAGPNTAAPRSQSRNALIRTPKRVPASPA